MVDFTGKVPLTVADNKVPTTNSLFNGATKKKIAALLKLFCFSRHSFSVFLITVVVTDFFVPCALQQEVY